VKQGRIVRKGLRYLGGYIRSRHRGAGGRGQPQQLGPPGPVAPATPAAPGATPDQIFKGYADSDLRLFDLFSHAQPQPQPGFVTDFLGNRTRTTSLWDGVRDLDGRITGRPVPHDLFETIEWIGLLKAVVSARDSRFAMMELGAGWGPWLVAGAGAARLRGLTDVRLLGVEADPGRFELMRQHFLDNDLDPDGHRLVCAAVGVESGHARWPRIFDPANAGGARPVRQAGQTLDQDDSTYMAGAMDDCIDIPILPLAELLSEAPVWDLVHVDVQGWEATLCTHCVEALSARARWLVIGTHSRFIEGVIINSLGAAGWALENEKPTRFRFNAEKRSVELMTEVDGVQVWRNANLVNPQV
jgi:FkbM family methyltransferase